MELLLLCTTAAMGGGRCDAVKLLLENDSDPTALDADGLTLLMNAAENGTVACIMEALLANADKEDTEYVNAFSKTGFRLSLLALCTGRQMPLYS
jgi:ankyrin repeat protein